MSNFLREYICIWDLNWNSCPWHVLIFYNYVPQSETCISSLVFIHSSFISRTCWPIFLQFCHQNLAFNEFFFTHFLPFLQASMVSLDIILPIRWNLQFTTISGISLGGPWQPHRYGNLFARNMCCYAAFVVAFVWP